MMQSNSHNPNKDFEVVQPPTDGVSSLCFSPKANFLAATSWDNQVRCWGVDSNGSTQPKGMISHDQPPLTSCWYGDGSKIFSAGCDKIVKCWDLASSQTVTVAAHDAPIKSIHWIQEVQMLFTASWDKTVKYWDTRSPNPAATLNLPERCYAADVKYPLAVVGCADRNNVVIDLRNPTKEYKRLMSQLRFQTRCLSCFTPPHGGISNGFAVGTIEGRVAIVHVDEKEENKNFSFKCHRENNDIYAVNSIVFHPVYGTFATAGSDGTFNFWDKDSKQRLKAFSKSSNSISCSTFNHDGTIYAYAVSYDWSKGHASYNPSTDRNSIFLHAVQDAEIKQKNKKH